MKELIFHQNARYSLVREIIEKNRKQESYTILEVGSGAHHNLADFLPNDKITFLDIALPEEVLSDPRFMIGDATNLPFEDESIDYIIGLDVLEHIPVEKRHAFFQETMRVSRVGIILTFPHAHSAEDVDDDVLREFYKLTANNYPIWLDEHIACSLPTWQYASEETHQIDSNVTAHHLFRSERQLMYCLLRWEALASVYPEVAGLFGAVNDRYCNEFMMDDFCDSADQATKTCVVIDKHGSLECGHEINEPCRNRIAQFRSFAENLFVSTLGLVNLSRNTCIDAKLDRNTCIDAKLEWLEIAQGAQRSVLAKLKHYLIPMDVENEWRDLDALNSPKEEVYPQNCPVMMDVLLICYNQSQFIEQTLETILEQKTEGFRYRIVVADDASKDDTVEKIQRMLEGSGVEFLILPHDQNHGIMQNYKRAFASCTSKYIAVMEGDDLWTDPMRLQKHFCFLEAHTECVMSFNCYDVHNFETGEHHIQPIIESELPYKVFTGGDIAFDNLIGNFSTCVYRKEIIDRLPEEMYSWKGFDWITNLMISRFGGIGCLRDVMNIYRIHSNGVWSGHGQKQQMKDLIEIIDDYDRKLGYVYHEGFAAHKKRLKQQMQPAFVHKIKNAVRKEYSILKKISRYCPPIFIQIVKLLVPEAIREKMRG